MNKTNILSSVNPSWNIEFTSDIIKLLDEDYEKFQPLERFPPDEYIFRAFSFFEMSDLKVVILGQDPYSNKDEANGLAFAINKNIKIPPSLRNIIKEINRSYDTEFSDTSLVSLAQQGVLLMNTALTVRKSCPSSHSKIWREFSKNIIKEINSKKENVVYILWGAHAQSFIELVDATKNCILTWSHPSPLFERTWYSRN